MNFCARRPAAGWIAPRRPESAAIAEAPPARGWRRLRTHMRSEYAAEVPGTPRGASVPDGPLARWEHPTRGLLAPDTFIALAEATGIPATLLKIDQMFVSELPDSAKDVAVVAAIVALAHSLGMRTVEEGVETAEQPARRAPGYCET
jgi:hypothetical protein